MRITRTIQAGDRTSDISVAIVACADGYTYQIVAETPDAVFATADEAADAYAVLAAQQWAKSLVAEERTRDWPRCHYCGQAIEPRWARQNGFGVYQCRSCR